MSYTYQPFPAWRYGPGGAAVIVNSEDETPKGFSAKRDKGGADAGTHTAVAPTNGTTSAKTASKTTEAKSQTHTPPAVSAKSGIGGAGNSGIGGAGNSGTGAAPAGKSDETNAKVDPSTVELDADGHTYDPKLHAATKSKTKAGLWRMKVGVARPEPAPGYPKPALDL